jgi:hypothetical protein
MFAFLFIFVSWFCFLQCFMDVVAVEGVLLFHFSFFPLARFFFCSTEFFLLFCFKLFWFSSSGYLESFADAVAVAIMTVAVYRCIFTAEL